MLTLFRTSVWFIVIIGGAIAVLATFIKGNDGQAFAIGIATVVLTIIWSMFSTWVWGVRRHVVRHMGKPIDQLAFVSKDVGASRRADNIRALETIAKQQSARRLGMGEYEALKQLKSRNPQLQKIDWESVEAEGDRLINIPQNSVYLLKLNGKPFVARMFNDGSSYDFEHEQAMSTGKGSHLQLCAGSVDEANEIIGWLNAETGQNSIYRGQMLQVASPQDGSIGQTIRITKRPAAFRDRIILPDEIIDVLDRLVQSRLQDRAQLARFGHSSNLGILLHGAPGTGKTLMIRYLISSCEDHTVIVPTDMAVETLREAFRLGQYLQPAIMVLEDVDLLAQQRQSARSVDGLQELMNQLDGLSAASDTIVIMSTNRPEILEPALASRPGRVSQAVGFPLPDNAARKELLKLFLHTAGTKLDVDPWIARTQGASPAFLQELCKRAILIASQRTDGTEDEISVLEEDMNKAIHELVVFGGKLTATALGFPTAG